MLIRTVIQLLDGDQRFLCSFEIPKADKPRIRKQLQKIGIHGATLFPEVERQTEFIHD